MSELRSAEEYIKGILGGDTAALSRAITLIESTNPDHAELAVAIIEGCLPHSGNSIRIGITGVPGVGKSTFIDSFGAHLVAQGKRIAVLAVDPSSARSRGSILGDKTRMERLAASDDAYIRPSPSSGSLGGVTITTRETITLCEAAGFDVMLIETVGVGQSETEVADVVDFFLLLMLAGAGDELQGIKRGIMELADGLVINKADGQNVDAANDAAQRYRSALHLFPPSPTGWIPQVATCSALEDNGMDGIWSMVGEFHRTLSKNGALESKREDQLRLGYRAAIDHELKRKLLSASFERMDELEKEVLEGRLSPLGAARMLIT